MLNERLVHLAAQILELLDRGQKQRPHPQCLIQVHLTRFRTQNRQGILVSVLGGLIFKFNFMVRQRLKMSHQQIFISLERQGLSVAISNEDRCELPSILEVTRVLRDLVNYVDWTKGLRR